MRANSRCRLNGNFFAPNRELNTPNRERNRRMAHVVCIQQNTTKRRPITRPVKTQPNTKNRQRDCRKPILKLGLFCGDASPAMQPSVTRVSVTQGARRGSIPCRMRVQSLRNRYTLRPLLDHRVRAGDAIPSDRSSGAPSREYPQPAPRHLGPISA